MKFKSICRCRRDRDKVCCIALEYVVISIGVFNISTMIVAGLDGNLLGVALKAFATGWFVALQCEDTPWRRFGFFASYSADTAITVLV